MCPQLMCPLGFALVYHTCCCSCSSHVTIIISYVTCQHHHIICHMSTGSCDLWSAKALRAGMGAHVSACCCALACACACIACVRVRALRACMSFCARSHALQFRLHITCGARARDVDACATAIAALQARASLTLGQAAQMQFKRIMVSGSLLDCSKSKTKALC